MKGNSERALENLANDIVTSRRFLIATGAQPIVPDITGLKKIPYYDHKSIWDLNTLPERLLIVGAGPVGCEIAQALQRLGSQVTLITGRERILARDDLVSSRVLGQVFQDEGIDMAESHRGM